MDDTKRHNFTIVDLIKDKHDLLHVNSVKQIWINELMEIVMEDVLYNSDGGGGGGSNNKQISSKL